MHDDSIKSDTVTMIATMFAQEASISDLWHLDVLGIKDPIEKSVRVLREKEAREFLIRTASLNADGRYEGRLPLLLKAPDASVNSFCHCLPHRPVFKSYGSTKIRPVFDASAQKKGYPSLNQYALK